MKNSIEPAGANGKWAIRSGQWKLVAERERLELFDLQSDLSETHNLAEKHPDILAELKGKYYQWLSRYRSGKWSTEDLGSQF